MWCSALAYGYFWFPTRKSCDAASANGLQLISYAPEIDETDTRSYRSCIVAWPWLYWCGVCMYVRIDKKSNRYAVCKREAAYDELRPRWSGIQSRCPSNLQMSCRCPCWRMHDMQTTLSLQIVNKSRMKKSNQSSDVLPSVVQSRAYYYLVETEWHTAAK